MWSSLHYWIGNTPFSSTIQYYNHNTWMDIPQCNRPVSPPCTAMHVHLWHRARYVLCCPIKLCTPQHTLLYEVHLPEAVAFVVLLYNPSLPHSISQPDPMNGHKCRFKCWTPPSVPHLEKTMCQQSISVACLAGTCFCDLLYGLGYS